MGAVQIHITNGTSLALSSFTPHPKNPNKHSKEQISRLAKLFEYHGIRHPIIVSKLSGYIVAGHGRLAAAKQLKLDSFPVEYQEFKDTDSEYAFLIADNAIADWAELDFKAINEIVPELGPDFDIDWLGLKDFTVDAAEHGCDEDDVPQSPKETNIQLGDLFSLGEHRLLCGDCTVKENVERLMNNEKPDMVFTDPPYGINLDTDYSGMGGGSSQYDKEKNLSGKRGLKHSKIIGDDKDFDPGFIFNLFTCPKFLWGADYYAEKLELRNEGSWIVWDKRVDENFDKMWGSSFELCWSSARHKRDIARIRFAGVYGTKTQDTKGRVHPTQKPVQLAEWFLERFGKSAKLIWDGYLGSGSTLIACEKTNRKCYGMEIDPHYCQVIIDRWEKYSGKKAIKIA